MNPIPDPPPAPPDPLTPPDDLIDAATAGLVRRAWLYKLAQIKRQQNLTRPPLQPAEEALSDDTVPSLPDT